MRPAPLLVLPLLLGAGCSYAPALDPDAPQVLNSLTGEIVVAGTQDVATTFVLLTDAHNPPPPYGTGQPVNFSGVPASAYTGDAGSGQGGGMQSAPWSLTKVPDGAWNVNALMDMDGDFTPLLGSNAGATCGDWVGAHLEDLTAGTLGTVQVQGGTLLDDVTVVVGVEMTTERPAFTLDPAVVMDQHATDFQTFVLDSVGVASEVLQLAGPFDGTDPCGTMFLVKALDADLDGFPDPHPNPTLAAAGALDMWPKVYLRYRGDVSPGESWAAEAVVYPLPVITGEYPLNTVVPDTSIEVVWSPGAEHTLPDGSVEVVLAPDLPSGPWSVTVIQLTGQTWTVPNELAAFPGTDDSFDPDTQGVTLQVK